MANELISLTENAWLLYIVIIVKLQAVEIFDYSRHAHEFHPPRDSPWQDSVNLQNYGPLTLSISSGEKDLVIGC